MSAQSMTASEVLDAIAHERTRLMAAIDGLGDGASTVPVTEEGWTAKDVLAHLIHWATQVAFALGADVSPPVYMMEERQRRQREGLSDAMPTGDECNALAVAHYRAASFDEVRLAFEGLVEAVVARVRPRSDDEMHATDAVPWAPGRPLWEFVGGDTFLHRPLHAEATEQVTRAP